MEFQSQLNQANAKVERVESALLVSTAMNSVSASTEFLSQLRQANARAAKVAPAPMAATATSLAIVLEATPLLRRSQS